MKKIKLLVLADAPVVATGFAQVSKNILNRLAKTEKYDIDVIGINFKGNPYDQAKFPYKIFPAQPQGHADMYGRPLLLQAISGLQEKEGLVGPWDIIFTIQDPFIIEGMGIGFPWAEQLRVTGELWKRTLPPEFWFTWVAYFPVDSVLKENWVTKSIMMPDHVVAYCDYGKAEMLKHDKENMELGFNLKMQDTAETKRGKLKVTPLKDRVEVIQHGVDLNVFKPLDKKEVKAFRDQYFSGQVTEDTFLVVNISRNQPRKDIARTIAAFAELKTKVPKTHLYLHMRNEDAGGTIDEIARQYGLKPGEDYSLPHDFDAGIGYGVEIVNKIYNAADVCVTTTLGEGWGFITSEAFATKTPVVAPNITSITDIFGCHEKMEDLNNWLNNGGWDQVRGIPVLAGSTSSEFICLGLTDNERVRPLTNVSDLVDKLMFVYENPTKVKKIVDRAFEWVQDYSWEKIVDRWVVIFDRAFTELDKQREVGRKIDKANRNEPCPCGSGKKFKHCHGSSEAIDKISDFLGEVKK